MKSLVLNLDYNPLCVISHKRAVILSINNTGITVLSYYSNTVSSEKQTHKIPSVLLYNKYVYVKNSRGPSKKRILNRDGYVCQYCYLDIPKDLATIDHVIPTSRFTNKSDSNKWSNLVACCKKCNTFKGNRTPKEAGMKLLRSPKSSRHMTFNKDMPEEWQQFLA